MMELVDQLRPDHDERPILRKSGKISVAVSLFLNHGLIVGPRVRFDDVNLN